MSDEATPERSPDYLEPLLGFRLWEIRDGILFGPAYDEPWAPGENVATCRQPTNHVAPVDNCRCGFNAYHSRTPLASLYGKRYVAGAMAAWGDIETHKDGFRAERACVVTLCFELGDGPERRSQIDAVARRYGVEAVPRAMLHSYAAKFGRSLVPLRPRNPAPTTPSPTTGKLRLVGGGRGYWIGRHVLVDWSPGGRVSIAAAAGLARHVDERARVLTLAPGSAVAEGDAVAVIHTAVGSYAVGSPAAGFVSEVNGEVVADPRLAAVDPSEGGWLVRVKPDRSLLDECPLVWGRRGREQYELFASRVGPERMLDEVRLSSHLAATDLRCAQDAVELMRRRLKRQAERASARLQVA
jgi:glycine cleavage system H lipoate-binding protein